MQSQLILFIAVFIQVRVMTYSDVAASQHGAQLTNMVFGDRIISVMECPSRGWLKLAGVGQYAPHCMVGSAGRGGKCFNFYKDGKVGHNETHFVDCARTVLEQDTISKKGKDHQEPH